MGDRTSESRLRELADIVEGPRVTVAARFAEGVRNGDGAALDAISAEFEHMGDLVAAADAAAHAALVYRRLNMRGSALNSSTQAEAIAEKCGGASTPALQQAMEPLPLTDREREIGILIGQGLTNREVAQRLTLSIRTVESHLYRAMAKTGTTSRDEFARLLRPRANSDRIPG
jgi:DNA-binding CsgD family transcriptional regulator